MAKKAGGKVGYHGPLFTSGRTNGPVAGPKGGQMPRDPLGYMSGGGNAAPGGSPADRKPSSRGERATA